MLGAMTAAAWNAPASGRAVARGWSGPTDSAELLRRSGRGDEAAFAELYDETSARLFGLVLTVVRDPALSAVVTQEVYLHVWRHSARFHPGSGSPLGWIMTVAYRAAVERVNSGPAPRSSVTDEWNCCEDAGPPRGCSPSRSVRGCR